MKRILYILTLLLLPNVMWAQFADDPAEPGNKYKLTLVVSPSEAGRVNGAGTYSKGTSVNVYTYANSGYTFLCWKNGDEVVSTSSSFYYTMPNVSTTLAAVYQKMEGGDEGDEPFNPTDPSEPNSPKDENEDDNEEEDRYTLTIIKEPENGGRINYEDSIRMKTGETVYLYASPANGYEMDGWYIDGQLKSIQENYSYTMWEKNDTIVARFFYHPIDPTEPGHSENKEFIVISSQADLEAYANVEEFPRSVRINGTGISSLQSLSKVKKIDGDLRIENTNLVNLEGLDNLSTITGKLVVSGNRMLVAMDGIYSWDNIFYVLIEDNPELTDFCAMAAYALKNNPAGAIRGNAYNPTFNNIADGLCSKSEDVFRVEETSVTRGVNQLGIKVKFSNEPYAYTSLHDYVSLASATEELILVNSVKSNLSYELFFEAPKKEGEYVLTIEKSLKDARGYTLNQNGNSYTGEEDDSYTEKFNFGNNELYVVAQSPMTSSKYTDLVFNDEVETIPLSHVLLVSPSGKNIPITSIDYIDSISPARHRVNYSELDEDGNYTFTLSAGLSSKNGKNLKYPYQSTIELPAANLVPQSIVPINGDWVAGEKQQIKYTVNNQGSKVAKGKCVDVIYLSSTEAWNGESIELYRDTVSVNVDAEGSYTQTISVDVPTVVDGNYYLILKANVTQDVKELTFKDNMLSEEGPDVSVELLSDDNNKFTLERGESKIFRIQTEPDKNVEIIDKHGIANMYLGYFQLPNAAETPNHGSITILGVDASVRYYVMVSNNNKNQVRSQQCELSLRNFELEVGDIGRTTIVKNGMAWVPVEVIGCTDMPVFYLMDSQGSKVECKQVIAKTETSFYAQFDTEPMNAGNYSLYVECNGMTGLKDEAITISNEPVQTGVISKLVLPETSRIGSTITAYIDYYNSGNVDVPVPLFILSGQEGSVYELPTGGSFTSEAHIIGVNKNGIVSTLIPGESNRISVDITIPNKQISPMEYKLKTITEGCEGIDEPFYLQWLDVEPDETPSCYTDEEWNTYCNRLRKNVGETWRTFIQALSKAAEMFYVDGNVDYNANCLYSIILEYDLEDLIKDVVMVEPSKAPERILGLYGEVGPGTIYVWNNEWLPLVEAEYIYMPSVPGQDPIIEKFKGWKRTENCSLLNSSKYFFISHGMNNNHEEEWIKNMARELCDKGTVICVDWGRWSKRGGIIPSISAGYINTVSARVQEALNIAFNNNPAINVNMNQFHLIGHSHGAHVCGRLANRYNIPAKRITALDASEELSHTFGSQLDTRWNASYIDYYKSSVICGTEYLPGDDNFILAYGDGEFKISPNIFRDMGDEKHGYAYDWFKNTINSSSELGFNWGGVRIQHPKVINHQGWSGVINGKEQNIENYTKHKDKTEWNYPTPWYDNNKYTAPWYVWNGEKKASEWYFREAFASTIDYESKDLIIPDSKDYIQAGTTEELIMEINNHADNFTVPLDIRQKETNKQTLQALFVSRHLPLSKHSYKKDKESISYIKSEVDLFFLDEKECYCKPKEILFDKFSFNIGSELWRKLGGGEEEYMDCDFWIISAVDKSSEYNTCPIRSVKLWKGELYPNENSDNCKKVTLKVRKPGLICNAGEDQTITLDKNETVVNVTVNGVVEEDCGLNLSYSWVYNNSKFSASLNGRISLGVGKHTLAFRIKANEEDNPGMQIVDNEAEDYVVITVKPYTPGDEDDEETNTASSWDPNEKVGIKGAGGKSAINSGELMEYSIYFENDAEKAQLAAQTVTVIDTLDDAFDLSTFEFTGSEVANKHIEVPAGMTETCIYTDLRPSNDLILKTDMKLDVDNRIITVVYSSLDTLTYEPTRDVFAGFLPPNDSTHVGEGHFSYRVKLKDGVGNNYNVRNKADIYFDYNDVIVTNITSHVVDLEAPVSSVQPLPSVTYEDSVEVSWNGIDNAAGIAYYDIYCSENSGEFFIWKEHTKNGSEQFKGQKGNVYSFFAIATDSLGYSENMKTVKETSIEFSEEVKVTAAPTASIASGTTVAKGTEVTLNCAAEGAVIYYTLDGSSPDDMVTQLRYDGTPIVINETTILRMMAVADGFEMSDIVEYRYYVEEEVKPMVVTILKKWDDVLICDNSSNEFVAYQWYKNDMPIAGETGQYYSEVGGLNGSYHVMAQHINGDWGMSNVVVCAGRAEGALKVTPSIVKKNEKCVVSIHRAEGNEEVVYLNVYNAMGQMVRRLEMTGSSVELELGNPGPYFIKAVGLKNNVESEKIMVIE